MAASQPSGDPSTKCGEVTGYNDAKGLITILQGGDNTAIQYPIDSLPLGVKPVLGSQVEYTVTQGKNRKPRATIRRVIGPATSTTRAHNPPRNDTLDAGLLLPRDVRDALLKGGLLASAGEDGVRIQEGLQSPVLTLRRFLPLTGANGKRETRKALDAFLTAVNQAFGVSLDKAKGPFAAARRTAEAALERRTMVASKLAANRGLVHLRLRATVQWRMLVGASAPGPWKPGLTVDGLLGLPYLPTSALHGIARRGARQLGVPPDEENAVMGTTSQPGQVRFLLGLPDPRTLRLEMDVATPHLSDYQTGSGYPQDSRLKTIPLPFLTVGRGTAFMVDLFSAPEEREGLEHAAAWLLEGMNTLGVGAKTSAGYGEVRAGEVQDEVVR